jgi:hypothetical protein
VGIITRPKKSVANTPQPKKEKVLFKCLCCGNEKNQEKEFYKTASIIIKNNNERMVVCKQCVVDLYGFLVNKYNDCKVALYFLCRLLDVYFDSSLYYSAEQQANNSNSNIAQIYFQKCNSLFQYAGKTFSESTPLDSNGNSNIFETEIKLEMTDEDRQNKEDIIRIIGYDPFENENPADKKYLYNSLIDYLDQDTVDDTFKLPICIEIVKSFNQIDKINQAMAIVTADVNNIQNQTGGIKTLVESKEKIYRSILAMAKDNGISVNHNNKKSKGGNTLNGIVKKLNEIGLSSAEVNLFDLETCEAMKQIADFSNKSILEQLMWDENDYTDMITQQKNLIKKLDDELIKLREDNRILKIKLNMSEVINDNGG